MSTGKGAARSGPRGAARGIAADVVKAWEARREGLADDALEPGAAERYFAGVLIDDKERLRSAARRLEPHLSEPRREALCKDVDAFMAGTLLPAYARLAIAFTARERNDAQVAHAAHGLERMAYGALGLVVGGLLVWAPFVPLWAKRWIWAAGLVGLVVPDLRRLVARQRYRRALAALVVHSERALGRMRTASPGEPE